MFVKFANKYIGKSLLSRYFIGSAIGYGGIGFTLGFVNCKVHENPLIVERIIAGATLGVMYGSSGSIYIPAASFLYLDRVINQRNTDLYLDNWRYLYKEITGSNGYKFWTDEEKEEINRPFPFLTNNEYKKAK
jgi:hypothetical protein